MKDGVEARYTLEFKQEAVRLVRCGERVSAAARMLGVSVHATVDMGGLAGGVCVYITEFADNVSPGS